MEPRLTPVAVLHEHWHAASSAWDKIANRTFPKSPPGLMHMCFANRVQIHSRLVNPARAYNGIGAISRDPVDAAIADGVQRSASGVTNRIVDRGLTIPPTIRVDAGKRVSITVTRRMVL